MKIIEELESLENGNNPALFAAETGLKSSCDTHLFDFTATLAALNALQLKYPNYKLLIGNKGEWDYSEFALFGERDETEKEIKARLEAESQEKRKQEAEKQKKIEKLKKQAAKLGLRIS